MEHISLYDLNIKIKSCLQDNLEASYWVVAEIGEMRINQKGHCYLELLEKKEDEIIAKNRATIWSYNYRNLSGWFESITGQTLKPGLKILSNIVVTHHEVYGLSLNIKDIDASYTVGERARRRMEILNKLKKEGVLEMNRQLQLPTVPQRIALIASSTSAGYQDFISQLDKNLSGYRFSITHYQAIMQGNEAEGSIIKALLEIHSEIEEYDLVVIIRGGGATLDLECFDAHDLASHVAQFPLPVITGIGHERDETIVDMVANTALKTPTAVAEFLISGFRNFEENLDSLYDIIRDKILQVLQGKENQLEYLTRHLKYIAEIAMTKGKANLETLSREIKNVTLGRKRILEMIINGFAGSLRSNSLRFLQEHQKDMSNLAKRMYLVDPKRILRRGYSITRYNDRVIKSSAFLKPDDIIESEFYDGKRKSKII